MEWRKYFVVPTLTHTACVKSIHVFVDGVKNLVPGNY